MGTGTGMQDRLDAVVERQAKQLASVGVLAIVVGVALLALGVWGVYNPDYPGDKSGSKLVWYGLFIGGGGVPTLWRARTIRRRLRARAAPDA